ncbi:MAG: MFS transporter [Dehalococcoidales bacterium]|nr:MFS transporter [Dehalococcoidales bacterium]
MESKEPQLYQSSLPKRQVVAAMVGTMLSMFLGSIFMMITATAMPRIITDLGGFSQYTWVFTSYIIAETIALPLTGKLSDMYGRKWFFVAGMTIFILGSFLCGISQSMTELIIYRAFQGIGFGVISALGFIVIADIFPPEERGKYGGLMAGVFGLSTIIGPTLGGYLTDALSWRWVFFAPIPIGLIIIIIFIFLFPQLKAGESRHRVDYGGVVAMTLFIGPLILALTWGGVNYAWSSLTIIGLLAFSVIMLIAFLFIESRAEEPVIPLMLFKNRVVAVCSIVAFCMGAAFFPVVTFIPLFFQGVLGATATASGGFLTPMMLSAAIGSFISGQLLSRAGGHYRLQGAVGFLISAVGFFLLTRMTPETSYATAVVNIILIGLGNGLIMPVHTIAVQNTVPYSIMGTATSMITLLRPLGGVFGLAIVGSILNNTFASSFIGKLSPAVKEVVSPEQLAAIVDNPQALVNPEAQAQLQSLFDGMGSQGTVLYEQLLFTLRNALNSALIQVFIVFLVVTILGLLANFFLKGIPPHRSKQGKPAPEVKD